MCIRNVRIGLKIPQNSMNSYLNSPLLPVRAKGQRHFKHPNFKLLTSTVARGSGFPHDIYKYSAMFA